MPAVIRPVSVQHAYLRHRWIPMLLCLKVTLYMLKILKGHGQPQGPIQLSQFRLRHVLKSRKYRYIRRLLVVRHQRIRFYHIRLPGIHRIDAVSLDPLKLLVGYNTRNQISNSRFDNRFFILFQKLHTLYRGICPLVKLPRQILHAEHPAVLRDLNRLFIQNIHRRLRENRPTCLPINLLRKVLHIIADKHADILHPADSKIASDFLLQFPRLNRKRLLLLHINPLHVSHAAFLL